MIANCIAARVISSFCILTVIFSVTGFSSAQAQSKPWLVPQQARLKRNPEAGNPGSINDGKVIYTSYCTPCHGKKGHGDGDAAVALHPRPANHTLLSVQQETDGALYYKISEGRGLMPRYKSSFSDKQRWSLVCYIRTLSENRKK